LELPFNNGYHFGIKYFTADIDIFIGYSRFGSVLDFQNEQGGGVHINDITGGVNQVTA
jgi:hypothetical protein